MKTGPALASFAALVDRSFVQIEEAARDARTLPGTSRRPAGRPTSAALRLLSLTTAGTRYLDHRPAWAVVHLAPPPLARQTDGGVGVGVGRQMGSVEFDSFDRLRLRPGAFTAPGRIEYDPPGLVLSGEDGAVLFSVSGSAPGHAADDRPPTAGQARAGSPTIGP